jgi:hypothetical protein
VLIDNISPNELLILLPAVAFAAILLKSVTIYLGSLSAAAFSNSKQLVEVDKELCQLEMNIKLYDKMPDRIQELIQIIKRELDRRIRFRSTPQ